VPGEAGAGNSGRGAQIEPVRDTAPQGLKPIQFSSYGMAEAMPSREFLCVLCESLAFFAVKPFYPKERKAKRVWILKLRHYPEVVIFDAADFCLLD
jgi:hypothetical protein